MQFHENPTNTAGRASNGPERSRWRDEDADPELVCDPLDSLTAVYEQRRAELQQSDRPLSAEIAHMYMRRSSDPRAF